jgi:hypothetical protein
MRWRRTKPVRHTSYCSTHPKFSPKSAVTEGLLQETVGRSGAGHQVIAAEAYCQLSPGLQKKVTEILKAIQIVRKMGEVVYL